MIRNSLLDLIEVSSSIKVAFNASCYEVHYYEDGSYTEIRLNKITSVEKLANLSKGFEVGIFTESGQIIIRVYENNQGEQ